MGEFNFPTGFFFGLALLTLVLSMWACTVCWAEVCNFHTKVAEAKKKKKYVGPCGRQA